MPFLAGVCALGATLALSRALIARERSQLQLRTDAEAKHVAAQLRAAMLMSLDALPKIGEWWLSQGRPGSPDDWSTDRELFLRSDFGLREVFWLDPGGKPVWCVKPGAQPDFSCSGIGPGVRALARGADAGRSMLLSNVVVRDGVPQVYASTPIRHKHLAGFVAAAFDASSLVQSLLWDQIPSGYELRIAANGRTVATLPYSGGPLWREGLRAATVRIANRWWSVELTPATSNIQALQHVVWGFGVVVSVLIYTCAGLALIYKRNESALRFEIHERERAEEQVANLNRDLQHQVDDFRTLLDVLPVGIAVSNDAGCRDIWVNPRLAAMLRTPVERNVSFSGPEAGSLPHRIVRDGQELAADELPMQVAARTGESVLNVEFDIVRDDGSVLNTLSYAVPVFDRQRQLRRVINVCVDITERKHSEQQRLELEDRVQRAEKYRSLAVMAAGVAHDFNNLLTAIIGYSELAQREIPPGAAAEAIREVLGAAEKAAELAGQLLAYTGRAWFEFHSLDLSAELRSMSAQIRAMVQPNVEIEYELAPVLPPIQAGARQVRQIVSNLVANAAEAIGKRRGTIEVRTGWCALSGEDLARDYPDQKLSPGTYVRLEVSDSGGGMPSEAAGRVFDPFFTTKFLGRGLGLSAVHGIMLAHGGGVRFDSSHGRGARVEAIFPAAAAEGVRDRVA